MDKGFNDQELSDIMKEIEALEEEFSADEDSTKVEASAIMEDLAEMEEEQSIPATNREETFEQTTVLPFAKKEIAQPTKATSSMSFKVQGDLNLELHFEVGGKNIALEVTDKGLTIQMDGGISFTVPVSDAQSYKKAV
jgi:hypothetical protein